MKRNKNLFSRKRAFFCIVWMIFVFFCLFLRPQDGITQTIELKFSHWIPPSSIYHYGAYVPWAKEIERLTGGRVKITFYQMEALGKAKDHYQLCIQGLADIVMIDPEWTPGLFPLSQAISLPFLFFSAEAASAAYYEVNEKYLLNTEFKHVKLLWTQTTSPVAIHTVKKPVHSMQDLKGLVIGVTSRPAIECIKLLGGSPQFVPMPDIYTALEKGVLDGFVQTWSAAKAFRCYEVTKYRTDLKIWVDKMAIVMNMDKWNKLPPDVKDIFERTTGLEKSRATGAIYDHHNEKEALGQVIKPYDSQRGNPPVYSLSREEILRWKEIVKPMWENWVRQKESEKLPARAFFNDLLKAAEKYNPK